MIKGRYVVEVIYINNGKLSLHKSEFETNNLNEAKTKARVLDEGSRCQQSDTWTIKKEKASNVYLVRIIDSTNNKLIEHDSISTMVGKYINAIWMIPLFLVVIFTLTAAAQLLPYIGAATGIVIFSYYGLKKLFRI